MISLPLHSRGPLRTAEAREGAGPAGEASSAWSRAAIDLDSAVFGAY